MARKIKIKNSDAYAVVDDCDYKYAIEHTWYMSKGRPLANVDGMPIFMHAFILGRKKGMVIDHANGNPLDNRRVNLRHCTQGQNIMNSRARPGSSKYKGVDYKIKQGKWRARIRLNGVESHIGYYSSEKQASLAYNEAAKKLHGEYAWLNVVE